MSVSIARASMAYDKPCSSPERGACSTDELDSVGSGHVIIDSHSDILPQTAQLAPLSPGRSSKDQGIIEHRSGTNNFSDHFESGSAYAPSENYSKVFPQYEWGQKAVNLRTGFSALAEAQGVGFEQKLNQVMHGLMSAHLTRI